MKKYDQPPRKVLITTCVQGFYGEKQNTPARLDQLSKIIDDMAEEAAAKYPDKAIDLMVLPENAVTAGQRIAVPDKAREFDGEIARCFAGKAKQYNCYIVVPLHYAQDRENDLYFNAAVLVDRKGEVAGIYRKIHPVAVLGSDVLEQGIAPGCELPVFDCDFGKLGVQICYDMVFDDGWEGLAGNGAEIVVWPTASPATAKPAARACHNRYYVVSSTYRNNCAVFEPTGMICAKAMAKGTPGGPQQPTAVLAQEIDLSYMVLPWSTPLNKGQAMDDAFGDRVGYNYYEPEDVGIFWSNDPATTIGEMARQIGVLEADEDIERNRQLQDEARGGPIEL